MKGRASLAMGIVLAMAMSGATPIGAQGAPQQPKGPVLFAHSFAFRYKSRADAPRQGHRGRVVIRHRDRTIPLQLSWVTQPDSAGCGRVSGVRVERTGGPADVVLSNVEVTFGACEDGGDGKTSETATVSLKAEVEEAGGRTSGGLTLALLRGNGEFAVLGGQSGEFVVE